jgi:hypothetical protein
LSSVSARAAGAVLALSCALSACASSHGAQAALAAGRCLAFELRPHPTDATELWRLYLDSAPAHTVAVRFLARGPEPFDGALAVARRQGHAPVAAFWARTTGDSLWIWLETWPDFYSLRQASESPRSEVLVQYISDDVSRWAVDQVVSTKAVACDVGDFQALDMLRARLRRPTA